MSGTDLGELAAVLDQVGLLGERGVRGRSDVVVADVHHDSRQVTPGSLFCCVTGLRADGHDHAAAAVEAGAVALLCERPLEVDVAQIEVTSVREAMGPASALVHGNPADRLLCMGVTGTNGKTTTVALLASILTEAGHEPFVVGTLTGVRTTPEAPDLQRQLAAALEGGKTAAVMEVSSHALAQHRVDGMRFTVAAFTNLSPDHLDFHTSMAEYFRVKATLFEPRHADQAVVNLDDPHGRLLHDAALIPTTGTTIDDAEPVVVGRPTTFHWHDRQVALPLVGRFNVDNALLAATIASMVGVDDAAICRGLEGVAAVDGRFESVDEGQPFAVVVDFAHTPDGLERTLVAARELAGERRVHLVFGAGGDRDVAKRPLMGAVAERLADRVIVTNDNPRGDDPQQIVDQILAGMDEPDRVLVELDRRQAIADALTAAADGDVVMLAGKGHEQRQTIGGAELDFDDRRVARELLHLQGWTR